MVEITNEKIAIFVLSFISILLLIGFIVMKSEYEREISNYNRFISALGMKNATLIEKEISSFIRDYINTTNESIELNVKYAGIVNGLYRYNITINTSWDYVYTTIDGAFIFLPSLNPDNTITFTVYPLLTMGLNNE